MQFLWNSRSLTPNRPDTQSRVPERVMGVHNFIIRISRRPPICPIIANYEPIVASLWIQVVCGVFFFLGSFDICFYLLVINICLSLLILLHVILRRVVDKLGIVVVAYRITGILLWRFDYWQRSRRITRFILVETVRRIVFQVVVYKIYYAIIYFLLSIQVAWVSCIAFVRNTTRFFRQLNFLKIKVTWRLCRIH